VKKNKSDVKLKNKKEDFKALKIYAWIFFAFIIIAAIFG